MNSIGIGYFCCRDNAWNVQITLRTGRWANAHGLIRKANVQTILVGRGVNRNRFDVHFLTRSDNAQSNFTSVGYENLLKHESEFALELVRLDKEKWLVVLNWR